MLSLPSCSALCFLFCLLFGQFAFAQPVDPPQPRGITDFVEYWAATRLLLSGENPYSPSALLDLQRAVGWQIPMPLIMWNPPWTLALILPFGALGFSASQFLWLLLNSFLVLFSAQWLWRIYAAHSDSYRRPWLMALTFMPTIFVLLSGQIAPLILFGLAAILYFERKRQWVTLGAAAVLLSIKPQLLYLFWLSFFLWIWRQRLWRVVVGASLTGLAAGIIPLVFNPDIYSHYLSLYSTAQLATPFDWAAPTLGHALRVLFMPDGIFLQFVPPVIGFIWMVFYWQRHKSNWQWAEQLPLILLVSVTTSAYAWTFDQVVLLPAIIQGFAWMYESTLQARRVVVTVFYIAINALYLAMKFFILNDFWYFWMAPALLGTYLILRKQTASNTDP